MATFTLLLIILILVTEPTIPIPTPEVAFEFVTVKFLNVINFDEFINTTALVAKFSVRILFVGLTPSKVILLIAEAPAIFPITIWPV